MILSVTIQCFPHCWHHYFGGAGGISEMAGTKHKAFIEKYEFCQIVSKSMREIVPRLNTKLNHDSLRMLHNDQYL